MAVPVLKEIVRQHAQQAAFLWTVYDRALLNPEENPDMDETRIARVVEQLEAHLDGLRVAGAEGVEIAEALYAEYSEAGELFVVRMLQPGAEGMKVVELDLKKVRGYLRSPIKYRSSKRNLS